MNSKKWQREGCESVYGVMDKTMKKKAKAQSALDDVPLMDVIAILLTAYANQKIKIVNGEVTENSK